MVSIQIIVGLPNDRIFLSSLSLSSPHEKEGNLSRLFNLVLVVPIQNSLQVQQPLGLFLVLLIAILRCQIVKPSVICTIHTTIIMAFSCNSCQSHQVAENWDAKPIVVLFLFPFLPHNNNVSKSNLEFPFFILDVGSDLVRIIKQRWFEG